MICVDYTCDKCKHRFEELADGWKPACEAFPDGIPNKFFLSRNGIRLNCRNVINNGIKYEPKENLEELIKQLPDWYYDLFEATVHAAKAYDAEQKIVEFLVSGERTSSDLVGFLTDEIIPDDPEEEYESEEEE